MGKNTDIIVLQAGEPVKAITSESKEMCILEESYKAEQDEIKKIRDQIAKRIPQDVLKVWIPNKSEKWKSEWWK